MASRKASGSQRENVRVVCRIRPTNQKEISSGGSTCVKFNDTSIEVGVDDGSHTFAFDRIFGMESSQLEVFEYTAVPLVADVLSGYNATIFAYGQTGTGKTHTMEGNIHDINTKGIIPRVVEALFDGVLEADENVEFTFKVSYVEIYMEKIRDLLDDNRLKNNLTVREDKIKGIYIAGVTEEYVTSHEELLGIMTAGAANRAVAATGMNEGSSRSHSVFTITVSQKDLSNNTTKSGKLVLVDLAGSEMVRKSNASGQQLEEAKTINKSLSALGQVINALTDEKQTHVPYRDSKLTRILQDSLGGNAKTVLITAVSPSSFNANETVSTLRFGMRAKSIENKVTVNQTRSVEELEGLLVRAEKAIDTQSAHIVALTAQLQALQLAGAAGGVDGQGSESGNSAATAAAIAAAEAARAEAESVIMTLQETVTQLTQELDEERAESKRKDGEMTALTQIVRDKERLLIEAGDILQEAQRHYEGQRDRAEQLVREKADAVGELESLKGTMSEELAKATFNLQELEVTVETLRKENQQLQIEISEMSGDAVEEREKGQSTPAKSATPQTNRMNERSPAHTQQAIQFGDDSGDADIVSNGMAPPRESSGAAGLFMDTPLSSAERSKLLQEVLNQLSAICAKYAINIDASSELAGVLRSQASSAEAISMAFEAKIALNDKVTGEQNRRIRDMEVQRQRLEKDLAGRTEKLSKLQFEMDALRGMDGVSASEYLTDRERAHMRSLQQRLEQLVVVHRQLLRKFASLELENGEFRKKITLRDERIKQLENNSRGLTGNMRQQAERHVAELTNLREQIQILRTEHMQRMEAKEHAAPAPARSGSRTVRGGAGGMVADPNQPKSLRGGRTTSLLNMSDLSMGPGGAGAGAYGSGGAGGMPAGPGIFQRFIGGGAGAGPANIAMHSSKM